MNLIDLIDAYRVGTPARLFHSKEALSKYTEKEKKFCPKLAAKQGGFVSELLIHIF